MSYCIYLEESHDRIEYLEGTLLEIKELINELSPSCSTEYEMKTKIQKIIEEALHETR